MSVADQSAPQQQNRLVGYTLLLFMGLSWGLAISTSKIAGLAGGHPVGLALWQVGVAGTMLVATAFALRRPPPVRADVLRFNLICGVTGVAFPAVALFFAALHLPVLV